MVVQLRRDLRAIELRDVAPDGLNGPTGAGVDLCDVIIELPQEQGHGLNDHDKCSSARSAAARDAGIGSMPDGITDAPHGAGHRCGARRESDHCSSPSPLWGRPAL